MFSGTTKLRFDTSRENDRAGYAAPARFMFARSAMRDLLVRDALDRALLRTDRASRKRLDHLPRALGVGDPFGIEFIRTGRHAAIAVARVDHAGVAAVDQLEEMVLRLAGLARVADQRLGALGVLNAVVFLAAFA